MVTEHAETFAWPVSVKTCVACYQTSCILCALYEAANECLEAEASQHTPDISSNTRSPPRVHQTHACMRAQRDVPKYYLQAVLLPCQYPKTY